ncbi:hypothetical protein ACQY0O_007013 [Thecaphora frezii]
MPLNTNTYLISQGWAGLGVPLDGANGRGLKKPLSIVPKRTLSGIGKDRDRSNEWWDSIFTAGAKSIQLGRSLPSPSLPGLPEAPKPSSTMSLASLAKRQHARNMLMRNFVRGPTIAPPQHQDTPPADKHDAKALRKEHKQARRQARLEKERRREAKMQRRREREERKRAKLARRLRRGSVEAQAEAQAAAKAEDEAEAEAEAAADAPATPKAEKRTKRKRHPEASSGEAEPKEASKKRAKRKHQPKGASSEEPQLDAQ